MKSYFLSPVQSRDLAAATLDSLLPGERDPWLLKHAQGDAMAYFHIDPSDNVPNTPTISVDISGRHYDCDSDVLAILERVRAKVGGDITRAT